MDKIFMPRYIFILSLFAFYSCNLQRDMLYYPSPYLPAQADLAADNILFWPLSSSDYRGFSRHVPSGKVEATIVVFHGNAGTAFDRIFYTRALTRLGYRVILAEYPGYGGRKGKPGEEAFVQDAKETLRIAFDLYGGPIFLLGESLGCGVAAAVAKDSPVKIDGIILITPWDTLLSAARDHFRWIPLRFFMRDTYDTIGNLKQYEGRIAIVGAERDKVIPVRHALTLYESVHGDKKMYIIKGAGHNDWPDKVDLAWWKGITDFINGKEDSGSH